MAKRTAPEIPIEPREASPPVEEKPSARSKWAKDRVPHHPPAKSVFGYSLDNEGLGFRRRYRGLIGVESKVPIRDRAILSLVYTPGVAAACMEIN